MKKVSRQRWINYFAVEIFLFIGMVISFSQTEIDQFSSVDILATIFLLSFLVFSGFLFVKSIGRLKDIGLSAKWMFLVLIPIFGWGGLAGLLFLRGAEQRKKEVSKQSIAGIILLGGMVFIIIFIMAAFMIPEEEQNNIENTGSQINIDKKKEEVNVNKVKVDPNNTVQGPNENIKLYCGLKTREINFDNKTYYLSFSKQVADNYYNMEFVPKGEIPERYKEMLLVQCNTSDVQPMQVLFAVMKGIHQNTSDGKAKQYPIAQNGQKVGFDFVVGEDNFFKEWNMFSYAPLLKAKQGVLMFGLSKRVYADEDTLDNFENKKEEFKKQYKDKLMNFSLEALF